MKKILYKKPKTKVTVFAVISVLLVTIIFMCSPAPKEIIDTDRMRYKIEKFIPSDYLKLASSIHDLHGEPFYYYYNEDDEDPKTIQLQYHEDGSLSDFCIKRYNDWTEEKIDTPAMTKEEGLQFANEFVATFVEEDVQLENIAIEDNHVYEKDYCESYYAKVSDKEYLVMVDLDHGYIREASLGTISV